MSKKYFWLKIQEHFFEDDKIIYLEAIENGDKYIVIWIKLLLKCLKDKDDGEYGFLRFSERIPYDISLLAKILKCDLDTLRVAIKYFEELDMIQIMDDKTIYIECVQKMIGRESDAAERMRKHREKKKEIEYKEPEKSNKVTECYVTSYSNKELEEEIEIEKEIEIKKEKKALHGNGVKQISNYNTSTSTNININEDVKPEVTDKIHYKNNFFSITTEKNIMYKTTYKKIDCDYHYNQMNIWLTDHPDKKYTNYQQFVNNWLRKSNDSTKESKTLQELYPTPEERELKKKYNEIKIS